MSESYDLSQLRPSIISERNSLNFRRRYEKPPEKSTDLQMLTDDELISQAETLQKKVQRLASENAVFLNFLKENTFDSSENILEGFKRTRIPRQTSQMTMTNLFQSPDRDFACKISINQKLDLVSKASEAITAKIEANRSKLKKFKFIQVAHSEDIELTQEDILKATTGFEKYRQSCQEFTFQKFVHIMNEWSRKANVATDKFRLRYSSLRVQASKLTATLAHKRLIGENLNETDVENLRLENHHLVQNIENQIIRLLEMKQMTGKGNLQLSQNKQLLRKKFLQKRKLNSAIKSVEKNISKLDKVYEQECEAMAIAKDKYSKFKKLTDTYQAPSILNYVTKKLELKRLQKEVMVWSRKKELRETSLTLMTQRMMKLLKCNTRPYWYE